MSEKQGTLYVYMLGGFRMIWKDEQVKLGKKLSSKMLHLLMILMYSREEGVRREQLLEQLYGDNDIEQASNSLRASVYRLRRSLVAAGLPEGEYVTTSGGIYRWEADHVEMVLDVEEFRKKAAEAMEEKEKTQRIVLLQEACRMYQGEFLPSMIADSWVAAANWKYQEIYFLCLRELVQLLKEEKRYAELLNYCDQALAKYPYEEWQIVKMDCLTAMKEYRAAMEYYEQVKADYQRDFGIEPSEELTAHYRTIKETIQYEISSIEDIQKSLSPEKNVFGATCCDYLTFIDIYRYVVWILDREGIEACLAMFTIVDKDGVPLEVSDLLEDSREKLDSAISQSVRRADLYTRYGKNQFLMLAVGADRDGCSRAAERICAKYRSLNRKKKTDVYYTCESAIEVSIQVLRKNLNRGRKGFM